MGGKGSGGARPGSGPKKKDAVARALDGNAGHRGKVLAHPSSAPSTSSAPWLIVDEEHAPDALSVDERNVWLSLAPLALGRGTLTPETHYAFQQLCRNVVLERRYAVSPDGAGTPNHRGMIQRVEAGLGDFGLRAFGKPLAPPEAKPVADPVKERFFG